MSDIMFLISLFVVTFPALIIIVGLSYKRAGILTLGLFLALIWAFFAFYAYDTGAIQ